MLFSTVDLVERVVGVGAKHGMGHGGAVRFWSQKSAEIVMK
jgi:hypothetical protein